MDEAQKNCLANITLQCSASVFANLYTEQPTIVYGRRPQPFRLDGTAEGTVRPGGHYEEG